ncbi:hypothetical protein SK58_03004 [Enterobacter sp. BIDMC93]|nr:hypothetical protein SK58_03004 [Enterobacter sp. BIDMC93]
MYLNSDFIRWRIGNSESFQRKNSHFTDASLSFNCHCAGVKKRQMGKAEGIMNDPMFVETLIISSSFFIIAIILIASVLLLENG